MKICGVSFISHQSYVLRVIFRKVEKICTSNCVEDYICCNKRNLVIPIYFKSWVNEPYAQFKKFKPSEHPKKKVYPTT